MKIELSINKVYNKLFKQTQENKVELNVTDNIQKSISNINKILSEIDAEYSSMIKERDRIRKENKELDKLQAKADKMQKSGYSFIDKVEKFGNKLQVAAENVGLDAEDVKGYKALWKKVMSIDEEVMEAKEVIDRELSS